MLRKAWILFKLWRVWNHRNELTLSELFRSLNGATDEDLEVRLDELIILYKKVRKK
jgi:hypothetical protein